MFVEIGYDWWASVFRKTHTQRRKNKHIKTRRHTSVPRLENKAPLHGPLSGRTCTTRDSQATGSHGNLQARHKVAGNHLSGLRVASVKASYTHESG